MKKVILYSIFQLLVLFIFSQQYSWETTLSNDFDCHLTDIVENDNGDFFISTTIVKLNNWSQNHSLLHKITRTGELMRTVKILDAYKSVTISSLFLLDNGNVLAAGSTYDSLNHNNIDLRAYAFNNNLDLLWSRSTEIPDEMRFSFIRAKKIDIGEYLYYGDIYLPNNRFTAYIALLDSSFAIKKWKLPDPDALGAYFAVNKLNNTNFWALRVFPWRFEKLDSNFNLLAFFPLTPGHAGNVSVKWLNNSTFIYLTKYDHQQTPGPSIPHNLGLVRQNDPFDTTGSLFVPWRVSDTVDHQAVYQGIDFRHPDTIFAGGTRNLNYQNPYFASQPTWFIVYQTDSLFNLRWERFYGGDACYVMSNLLATSDGGCLIGGSRYDYLNANEQKRDIVILKLDKHGLITNLPERATSLQIRESLVYPNPGGDLMHIRIAVQHAVARLMLFDTNGRLVLERALEGTEHTINTSMLQNGTYLYKLTSPTGLNESGKWIKH